MPFQTVQDAYRWALFHGLQKLTALAKNKDVTAEYSQLASWVRVASAMESALKYDGDLNATIRTIDKLIDNGHSEKALELAELVWMNADKLGDPYWAKVYAMKAKHTLDRIRKRMAKARDTKDAKGEQEP